MKYWLYLKSILYTLGGTLVLIFNEQVMDYVGVVVGSVVFLYAINITIVSIMEKRYFGDNALVFDGVMLFIIGVILFLVKEDIIKVCLVWAVWSIMREGKELTEALQGLLMKKSGELLDFIESVVIIFFSFTMILNTNEHHVRLHVYLLGVELLLEVLFPVLKLFLERRHEKKKDRKNSSRSVSDTADSTPEPFDDALIQEKNKEDEYSEKKEELIE